MNDEKFFDLLPCEHIGSKLTKAQELGVPVLDEAGMLALLASQSTNP